jgi:hypothetical protein
VPPMPENPALTEEERAELQRLRAEVAALRTQVQLRSKLDTGRGGTVGVSSLTTAELRLLPLLFTHLSFRKSANGCMCPAIRSRPRPSRCTESSAPLPVARPSSAPNSSALAARPGRRSSARVGTPQPRVSA